MKRVGYIYAVEFIRGMVKIGASRFPDKRIKTISAMNGCKNPEFYISELVESHLSIECAIHKYLDDKKIFSETFNLSMNEAIDTINSFCNKVTSDRAAELEEEERIHSNRVARATEQLLNQPKEIIAANEKLLRSCIEECNEWLDNFGDEKDAVEFMNALDCPLSVMAVSNRIKSKAIDALMSALNGDDTKLMKLGFTK